MPLRSWVTFPALEIPVASSRIYPPRVLGWERVENVILPRFEFSVTADRAEERNELDLSAAA